VLLRPCRWGHETDWEVALRLKMDYPERQALQCLRSTSHPTTRTVGDGPLEGCIKPVCELIRSFPSILYGFICGVKLSAGLFRCKITHVQSTKSKMRSYLRHSEPYTH
jgi:hypothetical protein